MFVSFHGSVELKIGYVDGHEFGVWNGNDAVEHDFDEKKFGCWCAYFAGIVDYVATDGEASLIGLLLFGAYIALEAYVCCVLLSIEMYLVWINKKYIISTFHSNGEAIT